MFDPDYNPPPPEDELPERSMCIGGCRQLCGPEDWAPVSVVIRHRDGNFYRTCKACSEKREREAQERAVFYADHPDAWWEHVRMTYGSKGKAATA